MDPLTIGSGVCAFIGLAGQMAEAISWYRKKWAGIKGAPKLIQKINREMLDIENTVTELAVVEQHVRQNARDGYKQMLDNCWEQVEEVLLILWKVPIQNEDKGPKRLWKSYLADGKRHELEDGLRNLERAKNTLNTFLTALNVQVASETRSGLAAHVTVVEPSLRRIEANLTTLTTTSENIYSQTIEIQQDIADSSTEIMRHMDHVAQRMSDSLPRMIEDGFQKCLEGVVSDLIRQDVPRRRRDSAIGVEHPRTSSGWGNPAAYLEDGVRTCEQKQVVGYTSADGQPKSSRKRTISKSFPLPIGFLQTKTVQCGDESGSQTIRMEVSLVPFRWLSSHGQVVSIDRVATEAYGSSWKISLRSYNIVPNQAMILQACRNRDLNAIQTLFQYGQASPFDVDSGGRMLMSHVWNKECVKECGEESVREAQRVMQFLITQGADPSSYVQDFLESYLGYTDHFANVLEYWDGDEMTSPSTRVVVKAMDDLFRLCLKHSQTDPFGDTKVLLSLWKTSLGGDSVPPLSSAYLFQEELAGLDDLVFELPDQVFYDVLRKDTKFTVADEAWQQFLDQNYETLVYLCKGGQESIKTKVFSKDFAQLQRLDRSKTCYCSNSSTHLLFLALHNARLRYATPTRAKMLRKHVRRVLVELFASGEDPEACCTCKTSWQSAGGHRTLTDLAGEEGLLAVWESALEERGFDAARIIGDWQYEGLANLFEAPPVESVGLMAPLKFVGSVVYSTLSLIV